MHRKRITSVSPTSWSSITDRNTTTVSCLNSGLSWLGPSCLWSELSRIHQDNTRQNTILTVRLFINSYKILKLCPRFHLNQLPKTNQTKSTQTTVKTTQRASSPEEVWCNLRSRVLDLSWTCIFYIVHSNVKYVVLFVNHPVIQARLDPFLPIDITLNPMAWCQLIYNSNHFLRTKKKNKMC
jgi:hypothetical protein